METQGKYSLLHSPTGSYDQYDTIMFPKKVIGTEATRPDSVTDGREEAAGSSDTGQKEEVWYSKYLGPIKERLFKSSGSAAEADIESGQQQCLPVYLKHQRDVLVNCSDANIESVTRHILHIFNQLRSPHYHRHYQSPSWPAKSIVQVLILIRRRIYCILYHAYFCIAGNEKVVVGSYERIEAKFRQQFPRGWKKIGIYTKHTAVLSSSHC